MELETLTKTVTSALPSAFTPASAPTDRDVSDAGWQRRYNEQSALSPAVRPDSDWEALYASSQAENTRLHDVLTASQLSKAPSTQGHSVKAAVTAKRVTALLGAAAVMKLSRDQKVHSLGVDPKSITDDGLQKLFGRRQDGKTAIDLHKTNPARYAQLREVALILNLYAK